MRNILTSKLFHVLLLFYTDPLVYFLVADNLDSSSISSVSCPHDVPGIEAHLYFAGLRGANRPGPKLIFRTSSDVFVLLSGPEAYRRLMQLRPVYEHPKLGTDNLWDLVRSEVRDLVNTQGSVD